MSRNPSTRVATSPGCAPLLQMFQRAQRERWSRWAVAEGAFLEAMWKFDDNFSKGVANQGDNQNGKGDFFTDLMCVLLEACSKRSLSYRPRVPGLIFRQNNLDAAYPEKGVLQVLIETKMLGAPKNPRSAKQKNPLGRRGSADLDKRVKEAGLKTIDLKAEWARTAGEGGGPGADFVTWLRSAKPTCYLLLGVRVIDDADLQQAIRMAGAAGQVMDGVGLICYGPGTRGYRSLAVPTANELDRVFSRICDQLRRLPAG